jgi:hypothetical protein
MSDMVLGFKTTYYWAKASPHEDRKVIIEIFVKSSLNASFVLKKIEAETRRVATPRISGPRSTNSDRFLRERFRKATINCNY